jgi:RES domain-containing protein
MSFVVSDEAIAAAKRHVRPFGGQVVYRQLPVQNPADLWAPTTHPGRWNLGVPALYTSLLLDVALAERIKRTLARPTPVLVGVARASIARVLDLGPAEVRRPFGVTVAVLKTEDYSVPQRLGAALFEAVVTGVLVPAAIASTAAQYPRFRFSRDSHTEVRPTPRAGANLVIFADNLRRGDAYPEINRFHCEVVGIPA